LQVEAVNPVRRPPARPTMPWWLAAAGGAILAALAGWAIVTCPAVIGQLESNSAISPGGFALATQFWLLAHGGAAVIDGVRISLVPLGVTVLIGLFLHGAASYAARQGVLALGDEALEPSQRRSITLAVAGVMAGVYTVVVGATAIATDPGGPGTRAIVGAIGLSALCALAGARQVVAWRPDLAWPTWTRAIPRAVASATVILLLGGVVATVASLITHRAMIVTLTEHLEAGALATILLVLLQAAYLPNVAVWAAAWTTGAGFSLGREATVVLMGHQVETLPSIPLIGALPGVTPAPWSNLAWLAWGVAAGVVAAVAVVRARPRARFDETALVGGLSGVGAGLVFTLVALLTRGNLGVDHLVGLGPLPLPLVLLAPALLGFAGVLAGLVLGLLRRPDTTGVGSPGGDGGGDGDSFEDRVSSTTGPVSSASSGAVIDSVSEEARAGVEPEPKGPGGALWEDSARLRALGIRRIVPRTWPTNATEETTGPIPRRLTVPAVVIPAEPNLSVAAETVSAAVEPTIGAVREPTASAAAAPEPPPPALAATPHRSRPPSDAFALTATAPMTSPFGHSVQPRRTHWTPPAEPAEIQPALDFTDPDDL
jgi:hypothetical protein